MFRAALPDGPVALLPPPAPMRAVVREAAVAYGASAGPADVGVAEAATIHEVLRALHAVSNQVRLRFLEVLRELYDGNLFYELGYASYQQYCSLELGLARSTAFEYVRVAEALDCLPSLRVLFGDGDLSWEQVRAIARVATRDTERSWIELAVDETVEVLLAEVREARRTRRDAPRDRRYGLPNLMVRLSIDVTMEDRERVRAAFEVVRLAAGIDLGGGSGDRADGDDRGEEVGGDARPPIVRWADGILSGAIAAGPASDHRRAPAQTIVYRTCLQCRETTIDTAEGPLRIAPERVEELAPVSNRMVIPDEDDEDEGMTGNVMAPGEIDAPNTPRLTRQVLHRDGKRCANPGCGSRRNTQAHHVVFRSLGGRSVRDQEITLGETCHALVHQGLLDVTGSAETGLAWRRRPRAASAQVCDAEAMRAKLDAVEVAASGPPSWEGVGRGWGAQTRVQSARADSRAQSAGADSAVQSAGADSRAQSAGADSRARPNSGVSNTQIEELATALRKMGYSRAAAERELRAAVAALMAAPSASVDAMGRREPLDEAAILMWVLRGDGGAHRQ